MSDRRPLPFGAFAEMLARDYEAGADVFAFDRPAPAGPEPRPRIPPADWEQEAAERAAARTRPNVDEDGAGGEATQ